MQKNTEQNHSGIFEPLYVFREPGIRCASFCGDGRLLALGASQEVLIYELASGKITKRIGPAHGHACMLTLPALWDLMCARKWHSTSAITNIQ